MPYLLNGQAISTGPELKTLKVAFDAGAARARFAEMKARGSQAKMAMTFRRGTHDLWIRYWLAAAGIHPDKDVSTIVIPPAQMVANMKAGTQDAFCVGEPWGGQTVQQKIGYSACRISELWMDHPEKTHGRRRAPGWKPWLRPARQGARNRVGTYCRLARDPGSGIGCPMSGPPTSPVLALSALRKSVPGGRVLFDGLYLEVAPGEIVAVMGESGVGKSTLLNLIAGLDQADSGSVAIDGVALDTLDDDERTRLRRDRIGFVFQAFHILPHLTLAQNVALPLVLQNADTSEATARATAMLGAVGLGDRVGARPSHLSGGELQRVALARALVHRPAVVLADEPTGNLDPDTAQRILDLFVAQVRSSGAAAILVTHSERAAAVAERRLNLTRDGLVPRHDG